MQTLKRILPTCSHDHAERIKRGKLVKLFLSWLPLKRYYCNKCDRRFYMLGSNMPGQANIVAALFSLKWLTGIGATMYIQCAYLPHHLLT